MRKVFLLMNTSLDGFTNGPNGEMDWFPVNDEAWHFVNDLLSNVDTALIGRVTYEGFVKFWPAAASSPSSSEHEVSFSHWIDKTPKIVFSTTLKKAFWPNTEIISKNVREEMDKHKRQPGKDMVIFGGAGLAQTLTEYGLIDEYWIKVHPVVLGGGNPLFRNLDKRLPLTLKETRVFDSGVVAFRYVPEMQQ
ncbi:dihydrofolate reductase family protein [Danxiaibacter flavus]|uniref:Dihydrofolate reductase family protein n=1 Tax=Danxiaibacter flavus TaxID=3049108 RepID=A0ABV3ZM97_9BACT|nr:dihydrofolate reductase family protein [Chitinophagaceae bacterium DXS]